MSAAAPLLLHAFATFAIGGPQRRFATIAAHLGDRFRHAVHAMDGDYAAAALLPPELDVSYPAVEARKGDPLGNRARFRRALRGLRPDVLVSSNWGSIEWALANLPCLTPHIHMEDGFGPEERDAPLRRRVLARRALLRGDVTVVVPSRTLLGIAAGTWRIPPRRLRYIPNGVLLGPDGPPAAPPPAEAGLTIGTVAALRPEKNLSRLLRAYARIAGRHPARLVIAGDGPARGALAAEAEALGILPQVVFAGHVEQPALLLAGLDVFALSSDTEQMPLSLLEAMAAGLPVAATDVGDVRAMLAPADAAQVVPRDEAALAGCLAALLDDAPLRRRLGAANRVRAAQEYDQRSMLHAWEDLLRTAATRGGRAAHGRSARLRGHSPPASVTGA